MGQAVAIFNTDFYVVTATAIPLLWLTGGLASNVIARLVRIASLTADVNEAVALVPFFGGSALFRSALRTPAWVHALVFVGSGLLGEALSLVALYGRNDAQPLLVIVLVLTFVLLAYCSVLLFGAIVVAQARAGHAVEENMTRDERVFGAIVTVKRAMAELAGLPPRRDRAEADARDAATKCCVAFDAAAVLVSEANPSRLGGFLLDTSTLGDWRAMAVKATESFAPLNPDTDPAIDAVLAAGERLIVAIDQREEIEARRSAG